MREEKYFGSHERRGHERRGRSRFVLRERRMGFDRRSSPRGGVAVSIERTLLGLRDRPGTLRVLLVTVNLLNLADFWLTLNVLENGGGEANPIMRSLFELGPMWAGAVKVTTILLTSLLLWRCRSFRLALAAALAMLAIFTTVLFYHILGLAALA
jgi:hypothetical protein